MKKFQKFIKQLSCKSDCIFLIHDNTRPRHIFTKPLPHVILDKLHPAELFAMFPPRGEVPHHFTRRAGLRAQRRRVANARRRNEVPRWRFGHSGSQRGRR
jgi:hypothetical protein